LAVAYREDFLRVGAVVRGETVHDTGSLSVDDARANLETSVLPRLALAGLITLPIGRLWHEAPVAFRAEVWAGVTADRAGAIHDLVEAARHAYARAEAGSGEHEPGAGASVLAAAGRGNGDRGRRGR